MLLLCSQVVWKSDVCIGACVLWVSVCLRASSAITGLTDLTWRQGEQLDWWCDRFKAKSQPWIGNRATGADWSFRVERSFWQSDKHSDKNTRKNELLPDHRSHRAADCDWLTDSELKMAMRSLRHTKPAGSLQQDLFFWPHGDPMKNSLPSLYLNLAQG